jgi:SAM-dependent methyltransferase
MCFGRESSPVKSFGVRATAPPWRVVACRDCRQMYTNPRPRFADLWALYPTDYPPHQPRQKQHRWHTQLGRRLQAWLLTQYRGYPSGQTASSWGRLLTVTLAPVMSRRLDPYVLPPHGDQNLLDIGCGSGQYLARMKELGWTVVGLDASQTAAENAQRRFGVPVVCDTFPSARLPTGTFDLTTMWQVLEHLDRPRQALAAIRVLLRPGGRLVLTVPNTGSWSAKRFGPAWVGLDLPRHLTHFTAESLHRMLAAEGFRVIHSATLGQSGWIRHSAHRAARLGEPMGVRWLTAKLPSRIASAIAARRGAGESLYVVAEPVANRSQD